MSQLPLYKQIQHHIKEKIFSGELRPRDRVPSEKELMDEFRVSKITVKNALTGLADENYVVRIQGKGTFVLDEPHLNKEVQIRNSNSAQRRNKLIGFIVPSMTTKVEQKLLNFVEYFTKENDYHLIVKITRESSSEETLAIKSLLDLGVAGLVIFPTEDEKYSESLLRLSLDKFPFVFIDRYLRNISTYCVYSDNLGGVLEAVSYLLKKGHRKIALISPENTNTAIEDRTLGYEMAYMDHNELLDKNLWCHVPLNILRSGQAVPYIVDFLTEHPEVTAVLTLTTEISNLTYSAMLQMGLSLDNLDMLSFDHPEIPNVPYMNQDEAEIARIAINLLFAQINGEHEPQTVLVPVELVMP